MAEDAPLRKKGIPGSQGKKKNIEAPSKNMGHWQQRERKKRVTDTKTMHKEGKIREKDTILFHKC